MKVHITQCLCPERHCIMALVWEEPLLSSELAIKKLKRYVEDLITEKELGDTCALCSSSDFRYEDGTTRFNSASEALPVIRRAQEEQLISRNVIRRMTQHQRN